MTQCVKNDYYLHKAYSFLLSDTECYWFFFYFFFFFFFFFTATNFYSSVKSTSFVSDLCVVTFPLLPSSFSFSSSSSSSSSFSSFVFRITYFLVLCEKSERNRYNELKVVIFPAYSISIFFFLSIFFFHSYFFFFFFFVLSRRGRARR